ncbi:MAG TPA: RluA family pseudouridine synthase [Clostridiales bacterium]|nr:RluA family pseudouridine synthase [Clostridiales bacterium]
MNNTNITFQVTKNHNDITVKDFLKNHCGVSTRMLIKLKQTPLGITCNGEHIRAIDKVYNGDEVVINLPADRNDIIPIKMDLDIIYEDEHLMVINKPPYMPVHPTHNHVTDTLANGVAYYMQSKSEIRTFRAINRLDRDTTGLVVIAKNKYAAAILGKNIDKTYYAICDGQLKVEGTVNAKIALKEGHTIQRQAGVCGITAITHYKPIKFSSNHTLLAIKLETGRTHQIRVHMSYIGYPLAGDDMYGGSLKAINRQALHCGEVGFLHPVTEKEIFLSADLPKDMKKVMIE